MANITSRVTKLEVEAAAQVRPTAGWSAYWAAVRKVYGDHNDFTPEELLALDGIDPASALKRAIDKVYGPNR